MEELGQRMEGEGGQLGVHARHLRLQQSDFKTCPLYNVKMAHARTSEQAYPVPRASAHSWKESRAVRCDYASALDLLLMPHVSVCAM